MVSNMICGFCNEKCGFGLNRSIHLQKDLVTLESDHLWLVYFAREAFSGLMGWVTEDNHDFDGITLVVEMQDAQHPQGLYIEIKNLGFRWVYKQDIEGLMRTMTPEGSSSIQILDDPGICTPMLSLESTNRSE